MILLKRIRRLYNSMTEDDKEAFIQDISNTSIKQELLDMDKSVYELTLITLDEHFNIIEQTTSLEKQIRLKRFLETGLLKKRGEDDILSLIYMEAIYLDWKYSIINKNKYYLINKFPELFI